MNFIFQYGDFFNETSTWATYLSFIGSILGGLISGLIALLVYKMGEWRQAKIERQRLEDIDLYFRGNLELLIPSLVDLKGQIRREIKDLEIKKLDQGSLFIHVGLSTAKELKQLNHTDLFKVYISELKIDSQIFRKCMNSLNLIDEQVSLIGSLRKQYSLARNDLGKQFGNYFQNLNSQIYDFIQRSRLSNDPLIFDIDLILKEYLMELDKAKEKSGDNLSEGSQNSDEVGSTLNPFLIEKVFVNPLSKLLEENFDPSKKSLLILCSQIKAICWQISEHREQSAKYFKYLEKEVDSVKLWIDNFLDAVKTKSIK